MAKTKTTKTETQEDKPSIPLAVRDPAPAAPAKKNPAALLAGLAGKAKTVEKKAETSERPVLPLPPDVAETYKKFAPAKQLADVINARVEALKAELKPELFKAWLEIYWRNKSVPANPAIEVRDEEGKSDVEGMYIVQEKMKVQIENNENPAASVVNLLKKFGLTDKNAEKLVENELDFTPQTTLRAFNELVIGRYEGTGKNKQFVEATAAEQAVGQKILEFIQNELSADEQELVLRNTPKTVVKKGFVARAATYAENYDQLEAIFQVITPTPANKGAKFGVSDSPAVRTERLLEYASELLGMDIEVAEDDEE